MQNHWDIQGEGAADPIYVRYDAARCGYVITQDRIHVIGGIKHLVEADVEVAFAPETLEATEKEINAQCCGNQPVVY